MLKIDSIRVDTEFVKQGFQNEGVKSLLESLHDKFYLALKYQDRMFKSVVDVIICLNNEFPNGVTKKELLSIFNDFDIIAISLNNLLKLANNFKPQKLNNLTMSDYAVIFYNLVNGLLDDYIEDSCVFYNNEWIN